MRDFREPHDSWWAEPICIDKLSGAHRTAIGPLDVLCAASLQNAAEGRPGHYYGTDINTNAGFYLKPPYSSVGNIL